MQETPRDSPADLAPASFPDTILHDPLFGSSHSWQVRTEDRRFTGASLSDTPFPERSSKAEQHAIFQQPGERDKLPL
jgi:hypothetical protein